jgi:hypothetical protein
VRTMAVGDAIRWSCARCGVSAGRIDGKRVSLPGTWTGSGERIFCLSCSRTLAEDAATEAAPADSSREDLVRIRRRGLIEFEISRCPEASNRMIAQACRTSVGAVAAIREEPVEPPAGFPERLLRHNG